MRFVSRVSMVVVMLVCSGLSRCLLMICDGILWLDSMCVWFELVLILVFIR